MKILALVYNTTDSCSFYRAGGIFPDLQRKMDADIDLVAWNEIVLQWQKIIQYDIIFMQRPFSDEALSFCSFMKNFNIPMWMDYDDNLFAVPAENKLARMYGPETRERLKKIAALADVITVATPELKVLFDEHNSNVVIVPNAFNDFIFKERPLRHADQKMVTWRGSDSHIYDVMSVGDQLNQLTEEYEDWQFLFMGFHPWYLNEGTNVFALPAMDVMLYFKNMAQMQAPVLITPLHDSDFNRCKSNIAYIEASYFGSVCVCPDFPEWQKPGAINYENQKHFYSAVKGVINNEVDVVVENRKAWEYVTDELMLSKINIKRMEVINNLL